MIITETLNLPSNEPSVFGSPGVICSSNKLPQSESQILILFYLTHPISYVSHRFTILTPFYDFNDSRMPPHIVHGVLRRQHNFLSIALGHKTSAGKRFVV